MSDAIFAKLKLGMGDLGQSVDEHLQIVGNIFRSVGISAVIWGADALIHHGLITIKLVKFHGCGTNGIRGTTWFYRTKISYGELKHCDFIILLLLNQRPEAPIISMD